MSPTSKRFVAFPSILALFFFLAGCLVTELTASAQGGAEKKADKPIYVDYKGVSIGMQADDVRKKLGNPADKSDAQDFFVFSEKESAQVFYDKDHKVMAVSVIYVGDQSGAPQPKVVLGTDIEAKADGAMYKLIRYPEAGYWVSYNRTGGDDPLVTVTMQKIR